MKHEPRYISTTTIQGDKRYIESVQVKSYSIRYKDKKNRIVKKFDARKRLRVEVVFRIKKLQSTRTVKSVSYGLPLARRKRPPSDKIIQTQFRKKHAFKILSGKHQITSEVDKMHNLVSWTYHYKPETKAEKAAKRKEQRAQQRRDKVLKEHKKAQDAKRKPIDQELVLKTRIKALTKKLKQVTREKAQRKRDRAQRKVERGLRENTGSRKNKVRIDRTIHKKFR